MVAMQLEHLLQDFYHAARTLRRNPGYTCVVVLALSLGIGVNTTMLSLVDSLLFRLPAQVTDPEQLVHVSLVHDELHGWPLGYDDYGQLAEHSQSLDVTGTSQSVIDFGRGTEAREIRATFITESYSRVLGVPVWMGRTFTKQECLPRQSSAVAIVSYRFWKGSLHSNPAVLHEFIWIGEKQYAVVGVFPPDFNGASFSLNDVWLPLDAAERSPEGDSPTFFVLARIARGFDIGTAEEEATKTYLGSGGMRGYSVSLEPLFASRHTHLSDSARVSLWLGCTALIVLLIACANVGNLMLARFLRRDYELALRVQLGATRLRLISIVVAEIALLSGIGGVVALIATRVVAPLASNYLISNAFDEHNFAGLHMMLLLFLSTGFVAVVVVSIVSFRASRPNLVQALKLAGRAAPTGRWRLRSALLIGEVALTLLLSVGAGLFLHSLRNVRAIHIGFEPERILVATMHLDRVGYDPASVNAAYEKLAERARLVRGVEQASLALWVPLSEDAVGAFRIFEGDHSLQPTPGSIARFNMIGPEYFAALGVHALQGRLFSSTDLIGSPVVVVNQSFARQSWSGSDSLGKCILFKHGDVCQTVIGVVPDTRPQLFHDPHIPSGEVYFPLSAGQRIIEGFFGSNGARLRPFGASVLIIRTAANDDAASAAIVHVLEEASPGKRYVSLQRLSDIVDTDIRTWRVGSTMFSLFGALALTLTAFGVYGVLSNSVRQRTAEIGVRMALGARPGSVLRLFLAESIKLVALGVAIGTVAAFGLSRLVAGLLFQVEPSDTGSYLSAAAVLFATALAACYLPARRAMRLSPIDALRHE